MRHCASGRNWSIPDQKTLAVLAQKDKAVLKIDVKHLFPAKRKESGGNVGIFKKQARLFTAECSLVFKLYAVIDKGRNEKKELHDVLYETHEATLQAYRSENGAKCFSVEMKEPLFISSDKLNIQHAQDKGYVMAMARSYMLTVNILFPNHEDMDMVVPILNNKRHAFPSKFGKIYAKLRKLPLCPADGQCAPMLMTLGGKAYDLDYEMEVDAGWETSKETALQAYNRTLSCVRGLQLPSPISEPATPAISTKVIRLAYTFKDQVRPKAIVLEGCLCLFCNRREYHSLDRLHHHFKTDHDMFTFKLDKAATNCAITEVGIEVDISDKYSDLRASNNVPDLREVSWVAPRRPFDLKAYLKGDNSWEENGLGLKRKHHHISKPDPLPQGSVQPKKPSAVRDMPRVEKRRYRVPKAPNGLRFFRTESKRPLEENEWLSESDDGISDDWLKLQRNLMTKGAETSMAAKIFMMKWDDYMQDEQLSGDTHAGDAVVRFARKYRAWLKTQDDIGNEFLRKTSELHRDSIICEEVFQACINLINGDGSMIDVVPVQNGRHRHTPSSTSKPNGVSPKLASPKIKRKYVPGGPGGGGRFIEVEDDGKRRKKKPKVGISWENLLNSSQRSVETIPTTQETDGDIVMVEEEAGQDNSTKPPLREESPRQPSFAVQSGCMCGKIVDNDPGAISCANLDCRRGEFHLSCAGVARRTAGWLCPDCTS